MPIDPSGERRGSRGRSLAGAVVSTVPLVLLPFAVNVASSNLPGGAERWAWLSWPAIVILVALSWRLGTGSGAAADPASRSGSPADSAARSGAAGDADPRSEDPSRPGSVPGSADGTSWHPPAAGHSWQQPTAGPSWQQPAGGASWQQPTAGSAWQPPRAEPTWQPPRAGPSPRAHGAHPTWQAPAAGRPRYVPVARPRDPRNPWRGVAVPAAGVFTGVLVSQFHLVGVHPPFVAGAIVTVAALALCLAEALMPLRVPRGVAAGVLYTVVAGYLVLRFDSSRADLWYIAESGLILGLGVFLATRVRDVRTVRRILPGLVLTFLAWGAMGVLFAVYQGQDDDTVVANAGFFAGLSAVLAGTIATALQALDGRPPAEAGRDTVSGTAG